MISASVHLDRLLCHVSPEDASEPYMWTAFFYADRNTILQGPGHRIATYTPHANWTTRGVFPNGISAGDSVDIPPSLGAYQVVLDPAVFNVAMVGTIFVLLEQDSTPGYAIRAGHQAFAEAVDGALNGWLDQQDLSKVPEPTPADIQAMASQIQGEVMTAVSGELSCYHVFQNQDDYLSYGYLFLTDLPDITFGGVTTTRSFSSRMKGTLSGLFPIPFDYQVDLRVTAGPAESSPDVCPQEHAVYLEAAAEVQRLKSEIQRIMTELRSTPSDKQVSFRRELRELRTMRLPAALDLLDSADQALSACPDRVARAAAYRSSKDQLRKGRAARLTRSGPGPRVEARITAASPTKRNTAGGNT
jgi:hypothetical protein